jgi:sulfite reductase alpha subunit-like flavoprotein
MILRTIQNRLYSMANECQSSKKEQGVTSGIKSSQANGNMIKVPKHLATQQDA